MLIFQYLLKLNKKYEYAHQIIGYNCYEIFKYLFENNSGNTFIIEAIWYDEVDFIKYLFEKKNYSNECYHCIFKYTITHNANKIIKYLVRNKFLTISDLSDNGLEKLVRNNNFEIITFLLDECQFEIRDELQYSEALYAAIENNNLELTKYFITFITDTQSISYAIHTAVLYNHIDMVKFLSPYLTDNDLTNAIFQAVQHNNKLEIVKFLLPLITPDIINIALIDTVSYKCSNLKIFKYLIPFVTNKDILNRALTIATKNKRITIIKMLNKLNIK